MSIVDGKITLCVQQDADVLHVTNEEFLREIFRDDFERAWVAEGGPREAPGKWAGSYARLAHGRLETSRSYFGVATVKAPEKGKKAQRADATFESAYCVVLDDVGSKIEKDFVDMFAPLPSWVVETSPENFQYGFILSEPVTSAATWGVFIEMWKAAPIWGQAHDHSGLNAYRRLPVGRNYKNGHKTRLVEWRPEVRYGFGAVLSFIGLDLSAEKVAAWREKGTAQPAGGDWDDDIGFQVLEQAGRLLGAPKENGWVDIHCPWEDEHTSGVQSGAAYTCKGATGQPDFVCHHSHCRGVRWSTSSVPDKLPLQRFLSTNPETRDHYWSLVFPPIDEEQVEAALNASRGKMLKFSHRAESYDWDGFFKNAADQVEDEGEAISGAWFHGESLPEPPAFLVETLIPAVGLTFLGGQWGAAKSFIAVWLTLCVTTRRPFFGLKVKEPVAVIYIAAEGATTIPSRIAAACVPLFVEKDEHLPIAVLSDIPDLATEAGLKEFLPRLVKTSRRLEQKFGLRTGLVVVDTMAAAFGIKDENSAGEIGAITKIATRIGSSIGAATLLLAHHGKTQGGGLRGSSAAPAAAESIMAALCDRDEITGRVSNRRIVHTKSRSGAEGSILPFELKGAQMGVDEDGNPINVGYVSEDNPLAANGPRAPKMKRSARAYLAALEAALAAHGRLCQPDPSKSAVIAVDREKVRTIFYPAWPAEGDEKKRTNTRGKSFSRGEAELTDAGAISTLEVAGEQIVWLNYKVDPEVF